MNVDGTFRYVCHADIASYEAGGWVVVNDMADCHHVAHAVLMRFEGKIEPDELPACQLGDEG